MVSAVPKVRPVLVLSRGFALSRCGCGSVKNMEKPMTDVEILNAAAAKAARILTDVKAGRSVAFLAVGDNVVVIVRTNIDGGTEDRVLVTRDEIAKLAKEFPPR